MTVKTIFSDRRFYSKLIKLTVPIALQSLMLAMVAACDSAMLGRVDQTSMSAVSLATQIQFVQNLFFYAASAAAVLLGAQYWGKGNKRALRDIFCIILRLCSIVSVIVFLLCELIPEKLMWLFTSENQLIEIGADYLRIAGWSYLLTGISQCYLTVMKISDHAKESSVISCIAVILNIILNAIFIFGLLGATAMKSNGAALATLISRIVELALCLIISAGKSYIRPTIRGIFSFSKTLSKDFAKAFVPLIGASLLWGIGFTCYTSAMGHLGEDATAANAVTAVVRDLMCCLCNGISSAGEIMVGNELGKGNLELGKEYGIKLAWLSLLSGIICCLIILALIPPVSAFMILEPAAKEYLKGIMIIMAVYMIARCMCTVILNGIFAAGGDIYFDVYSLAIFMWGMAVPLAFLGVFKFHWPVYVVYTFTCIDEIAKLPWVIRHFLKYKWVKDLTRDNI